MPRPPGRDQAAPMERLVRLIGLLGQHPHGVHTDVLLPVVVGDEGRDEARRKMLQRDLEQLDLLGYDVRNVAGPGAEAVYVMRARDNRLQVHLRADQRGELLRAAIAAGLEEMAPHLGAPDAPAPGGAAGTSQALDLVQRGTSRHCLVRFTYKGEPRVVAPALVHSGPSGWYLTGREVGQDAVKEFVVARMSDVSLEPPGSAEPVVEEGRPSLDPLSWEVDPPTEVEVLVAAGDRLLAENLLGSPVAADVRDDSVVLRYVVTHRAVFRLRLYELGTRVRVLGPADVRHELVAELDAFLAAQT
jgi:predicted DNA-binding transcriptional regulator YafY